MLLTKFLLFTQMFQAGIAYSLFESESSASRPRTREWGMSIHWSRPLLEQLLPEELLARLREAAVDPSFDSSAEGGYTVPFYNGKTGEHIISMPMKNAIRVSRRKMRNLCSEGLDIKYGEKLVSVTHEGSGVTAVFASGATAKGTIVIGTDGPQSTVRNILLGDKAASVPLDVVLYNMNVCYGDAERALAVRKLHPMNTVALQPDRALSVWTSSKASRCFFVRNDG
jgi:2-polyprenyl-6-methoxyphenol hydroxylase-like FAD-dependent oxidoreductase